MSHISLRWVLIIPFVVQIVGAVGLVGYLSYRSGEKAVEEMMGHLTTETGDRLKAHLDSYLEAPQKINQLNLKVLESKIIDPKDFESLGKYFWQELQSYDFTYINYGNQQNEFIGAGYVEGQLEIAEVKKPEIGTLYSYQVDPQGDRLNPPIVLKGENPNDAAWYSQAIAAGKPIWSPIYNWADIPDEVAISASAPLYDQSQQLLGVVGIDLSLSKISTFLQSLKIGKSGKVLIVERSGLLVANSTTQKPYKLVNGKAQRLEAKDIQDPLIKSTVQSIQKKFGDFKQIKNNQKSHLQILDKKSFIDVIPYQDKYGIDWLIVVSSPKSDFMAEIEANNHRTILLCLLTLGIATGTGILTSRWITKGILRINRANQSLAKKEEQNLLLRKSGITEIDILAASFNDMAQQIKASFNQSESRYRQVVQQQTDFILRSEPDTTITFVNEAFCIALGCKFEEIIGRKWIDFSDPNDLESILYKISVLKPEDPNFRAENRDKRGDESIGWTQWINHGIFDEQGKLLEIQSVGRDITELKQIEFALRKSESRFQRIALLSPGAIYILVHHADTSRSFEYVSPVIEDICEFTSQELQENFNLYLEQIHPDDRLSYQKTVTNTIKNISNFQHEWRIITPSKKIKWIKSTSRPECRENGDIAWYGILLDISDRKEVEIALQNSETQYRHLIENLAAGVVIHANDSSIVSSNAIACELLGLSFDQLSGNMAIDPAWHFFTENHQIMTIADYPVNQVLSTGQAIKDYVVGINRPHDQSTAWVLVNAFPNFDLDGQIKDVIVTFIDITSLKQAEAKSQKLSQRLTVALESGAIGCWEWDLNSNVLFWDDRMYELYGVAKQSDTTAYDVWANGLHPGDRPFTEKLLQQAILEEAEYDTEFRVVHPDGSTHFIQAYGVVVKDNQEKPQSLIGVNFDISDRKQAEKALAEAKEAAEAATKAKSQFLANMSHEIRTPMNGVLGMAQLLGDTALSPDQKDIVQTIRDSGDALLVIINDILDFSKIESGMLQLEKHPFVLSNLIKSIFNLLTKQAKDKGLDLTYYIDSRLPLKFIGDASRLRQILLNLVGNAIKFTESGSVKISVITNHSLNLGKTRGEAIELLVAIRDTGIGIEGDRLKKLFQPFSQADASINRKYGGTGLGLVICKSLVELMGGTIWVKSFDEVAGNPPDSWDLASKQTYIQGSIFYFTLSLEPVLADDFPPQDSSEKSEVEPTNKIASLKILLVEDNKVNQKVALLILKKLGCRGDIANNGLEALAMCEKEFYDVILMDIQMPEMDGITATKIIRQSPQPQPYIIALTANALDEDRQSCLDAGMNDYLRKPIVITQLIEVLSKSGND